MNPPASASAPALSAPCPPHLTTIVRRHVHDVRNHLNGLELDTTLLGELVTDPGATATISQIRRHLTQLEAAVKSLLLKFDEPRPIMVTAGDLVQLWKMQMGRLIGPDQPILWPDSSPPEPLWIDSKAVVTVLCEITLAASRRTLKLPLRTSVHADADRIVLALHEPPQPVGLPSDVIQGAAGFMATHGGTLTHTQDPAGGGWTTTMTFPAGTTAPRA